MDLKPELTTRRIEWRTVALGAAVAAIIAVTSSLLAKPLSPSEKASQGALFVIMIVGFGLGGFYAGRQNPAYPLMNGTLSGALAWSALLVASLALNATELDRLNPFKYAFLGIVASFAGLIGGAIASMRERRRSADQNDHQHGEST